jgi:hypothetical protein
VPFKRLVAASSTARICTTAAWRPSIFVAVNSASSWFSRDEDLLARAVAHKPLTGGTRNPSARDLLLRPPRVLRIKPTGVSGLLAERALVGSAVHKSQSLDEH